MIHTMNKKIVTNLRLDEVKYARLKLLAAEANTSVNEYLDFLISEYALKKPAGKLTSLTKKDRETIWDLPKFAIPFKKAYEASDIDKAVYGLD